MPCQSGPLVSTANLDPALREMSNVGGEDPQILIARLQGQYYSFDSGVQLIQTNHKLAELAAARQQSQSAPSVNSVGSSTLAVNSSTITVLRKPKGEAGNTKTGYNLQRAMKMNDSDYGEFLVSSLRSLCLALHFWLPFSPSGYPSSQCGQGWHSTGLLL